jgi:uncharacterized protein (TIGR03437 family)
VIYNLKSRQTWLALACTRGLLCAAALSFATQTVHAQSSVLNTNLIVNGNAEAGPASPDGKTVVSSIPSWTRGTGMMNVLPYGLTGYVLLTDPAPPDHGFNYFSNDLGTPATAMQTINVASGSSMFAAGNIKFTAAAYLGSIAKVDAHSQVAVAFQNASGQNIGTTTLGPASYPGTLGMSLQQQIGIVPAGTMQITVTITLPKFGAADSLSLILTTLGAQASSVLGTNLVANGGAEAGPNATSPAIALYIPDWSTDSGVSVAPYGGTGWIQVTDPGPPDRGVNLFCAGPLGTSDMYQDLDVSPAASLIDSGQVTYLVSAWLGGIASVQSPTLIYTFFDWSGNQLAPTAQLGPNTGSTGLAEVSSPGTLPSGTRRVHIALSYPRSLSFADDIAFTLAAPSGPPVIDPGGIFSAGDFGGFTSIAPGSWIEIYGVNLTASTLGWAGSDFKNGVAPTKLGDVSVSVGGTAAFIDYVSSGQINAQVPSDAPVSSGTIDITVTNSSGTSDPFAMYVNPTQAGLLAPSSFIVNKKQYVAGILSDGSFALPANAIPGVASRPANVGETVTIYGVGFGPVTGGFTAGTIVTAQNSLTTPLQLLFGTTPAMLTYDGLAPTFVGLYQFDVVVPNVNTSDAVPMSLNLGGVAGSQALYIAVQN